MTNIFKLPKKKFIKYTDEMDFRTFLPALVVALLLQEWTYKALCNIIYSNLGTYNPMLISLYSRGITTLVLIAYCKFIEKRTSNGLGLKIDKKTPFRYIIGLVLGLLLFSVCVLVAYAGNSLMYIGSFHKGKELLILLMFFGFVIQGMSEEVMVRGALMITGAKKMGITKSILFSSLFFALLHIENSGISVLAFINLFLFGVFAALYFYHTNSLWGPCAFHAMWNFAQGNVFGLPVSGMNTSASIFNFFIISRSSSKKLITGGTFGLEGSIQCTIVYLLAIGFILYRENKNAKFSFLNLDTDK